MIFCCFSFAELNNIFGDLARPATVSGYEKIPYFSQRKFGVKGNPVGLSYRTAFNWY
jgi:hypothetical protein